MDGVIRYVVEPGDWLAKIAEEHGTTVGAIWNHPLNAEIRAKRSPDLIYPGDVFHIPVASPPTPPPDIPPDLPAPPVIEPPAPLTLPPWPYPPWPQTHVSVPSWDCPGGTCHCHPVAEDDETVMHRIVFRDGRGCRMPCARCMIYEGGRAITSRTTAANGLGELEVEVSGKTTNLWVEWAPASLPTSPSMPFGKPYLLVGSEGDADATRRRLANLGFSGRGSLDACVRAYQVAVGLEPTGDLNDVAESIRQHHDDGTLTGFRSPAAELTGLGEQPEVRTLFDDDVANIGEALQLVQGDILNAPQGTGGPGGTVVAPTSYVAVLVVLDDGTSKIQAKDVTARLMPAGKRSTSDLLAPTTKGVPWSVGTLHAVMFGFENTPMGTYTALAHVKGGTAPRGYALGSHQPVVAVQGIGIIAGVVASSSRPISSVQDPLLDLDIPQMQRRRRVLATLFRHLPRSANFDAKERGFKPDYDQGDFQPMLEAPTDGKSNSCTAVAAAMMASVAGPGPYAFNAHKSPGFFKYETGAVPSVGDNFVLWEVHPAEKRHHTGIVLESNAAQNAFWYTADGGQRDVMTPLSVGSSGAFREPLSPPSNEAAFIVPRIYGERRGRGLGELGNLHRRPAATVPVGHLIEGWLDITHPAVGFDNPSYDNRTGNEQDYQNMRKRIARVQELFKLDRELAKLMEQAGF